MVMMALGSGSATCRTSESALTSGDSLPGARMGCVVVGGVAPLSSTAARKPHKRSPLHEQSSVVDTADTVALEQMRITVVRQALRLE